MLRILAIALIIGLPGSANAAGYCVMPNSDVRIPFDGHLEHGGRISRLTNKGQVNPDGKELYSIVISPGSGALCVDTYTAQELNELSDYMDAGSSPVEEATDDDAVRSRSIKKRRRKRPGS